MTHDDGKHDCPIDGCAERLPPRILMCKPHWKMLPRDLQQRVYATWENGLGIATDEYAEARSAATAAVELREARD